MTGNDDYTDDTEWEFQQGETLIEQLEEEMSGIGGFDEDPREYTVKRRLRDEDEGKRLYYLEWTRDTPGGTSTENQLYDADFVRLHYRSVEAVTYRCKECEHEDEIDGPPIKLRTCPECGGPYVPSENRCDGDGHDF